MADEWAVAEVLLIDEEGLTEVKGHLILSNPEVVIYKRKHEGKKTSKHAFDQEIDQENKKVFFSFFLLTFFVESVFPFFFLIAFLVESVFTCFLTFLFSSIKSHLWIWLLASGP